ncbi:STN domain-containing protein, partial [Herbaspirillum sp. B65]|uniref:STN domain-containing protein n=1 Tax=Herbaspirillum sp. B65 TaxID=137708 RepID=UPI002090D963
PGRRCAIALAGGQVAGPALAGLAGSYSVEAGFNALLAGSGYRIGKTAAGYVLMPDTGSATPTATPLASAQGSLPTINVSASAESWSQWHECPHL